PVRAAVAKPIAQPRLAQAAQRPSAPGAAASEPTSQAALAAQAEPTAPTAQAAPTAPAAQTPPPTPVVSTHAGGQRLISLDFKDADVVNLLRILAAESGKNIVIGEDVKGKMSITLRNVPWDLAFQTVLDTKGLQRVVKDGVIRIVSTEQLLKEREAQLRVEESKL